MTQPFLLRFAKKCTSPDRHPMSLEYEYDDSIDMIRWLGSPDKPTVITAYMSSLYGEKPFDPPTTKKCDIEKGEDQKDRRMWNRP